MPDPKKKKKTLKELGALNSRNSKKKALNSNTPKKKPVAAVKKKASMSAVKGRVKVKTVGEIKPTGKVNSRNSSSKARKSSGKTYAIRNVATSVKNGKLKASKHQNPSKKFASAPVSTSSVETMKRVNASLKKNSKKK